MHAGRLSTPDSTMCDLSEGELVSSEGSDNEATQLAKRPRTGTDDAESIIRNVKKDEAVSQEMEDLTDGGWQMVEKASRKRETRKETPLSQKKKKKKRRRSVPVAELVQPPANQSYLNNPQKQLLRHLCQLIKIEDNWPTHPLFKTVDLQAVLRHICTGSPHCGKKLKRAEQLAERKVVMVWLSMVSKADFLESEVLFSKTKSLPDKVVFTIQHPGSNKFVRMGLEAFMEVPVPPSAVEDNKPSDSDSFTRADCLLSQEEMIENSYPCPLVVSDKSTEQYIAITEWPQSENDDEVTSLPIFAVDCEMVMTCEGHELARVSIVNESFECIYDTLVKPLNPVSDYLTKYSGIDADMLADVTTTLQEVHQQIKTILPSRFILAGHSLENDLQALKLFHPYVIDTSCLFTPNATPLLKPSLKKLTRNLLDKDIQTESTGHSSAEDATACMELVLKKFREGPGLTMPFNSHGKTMLLPYLASQLVGSTIVDKPSITGMFGKGLTKCVNVESDSAALVQIKEILTKKNTRFLFVQLHGMEQYLKFGERSPAVYAETVNSLDQAVFEMFEACPPGYLFMVVTGSSYLTEVRRLQQQTIIKHAELEREVIKAREGFVTAVLTPDNSQQDITPTDDTLQ